MQHSVFSAYSQWIISSDVYKWFYLICYCYIFHEIDRHSKRRDFRDREPWLAYLLISAFTFQTSWSTRMNAHLQTDHCRIRAHNYIHIYIGIYSDILNVTSINRHNSPEDWKTKFIHKWVAEKKVYKNYS